MFTYSDEYLNSKPMSLVERKKQQWAKEREELAKLNPSSYGSGNPLQKSYDRLIYGSNSKLSTISSGRTSQRNNLNSENERRSSLPPLYKNQFNSSNTYDREGETSGYGSDNITPENIAQWRQNSHQSGYESSSSYRDDRPKWGDKGVGVGKFWQPKEESFDKMGTNEPPNWVKRGLQNGEILVSNNSPAVSPEQHYDPQENERLCTGFSNIRSNKLTFIRGQNIPLDEIELAERERRRQIAMSHQEAIRRQLEERERKKLEEKERKIKEEMEEELRIQREQQYDRQRREEEERILQEKIERERRRKEAIQEAVELAEKEAKLEKMRLKMLKQKNNIINNNIAENVKESEKVKENVIIEVKNEVNVPIPQEKLNNCDQINNLATNKESYSDNLVADNTSVVEDKQDAENITIKSSSRNNSGHLIVPSTSPRESTVNLNSNIKRSLTPTVQNNHRSPRNSISDASNSNIEFLLQSFPTLNLQYALILPNMNPINNNNVPQIPIAIPLTVPQSARSVVSTTRTENRVLTPSRYRNNSTKSTCDSSTQTDLVSVDDDDINNSNIEQKFYTREKLTNLELTYDNRRNKERRRSRSENVGERPKWNANRPPTRYLKQSEKDPLYQRRKMRQKRRDDEKNNSSDDSQTATPRYNSGSVDKIRHSSRGTWKKSDQIFTRNIRMYQTEIVPLETDKDQLYYKCCCVCKCQRHKCGDNVKVDMLKIEESSPRQNVEYKAEVIERGVLPNLGDNENGRVDILDTLTSLHNGLMMEQEKWENSPRTPVDY